MMFENGILAEIEVENLNHLEERIRRLHGPDRKITVLFSTVQEEADTLMLIKVTILIIFIEYLLQ